MVRPALHTTLFFEEEADDGKAGVTEEEDAIDELVLNDQVVADKRQDGRITLMFRADCPSSRRSLASCEDERTSDGERIPPRQPPHNQFPKESLFQGPKELDASRFTKF